jgi:hypothetical protein
MSNDEPDNPGIKVPPPLIYILPLFSGLILDRKERTNKLPMPGNIARNAGGAREWREAREVRGCRGSFRQGHLRRSRRDGCDDYLEYDRDEAARTPSELRPDASRHQGARCPTYRRGERGAFLQPRPLGVRQRLGRCQGTPRSRRTIGTGGHSGTLRGSLGHRAGDAAGAQGDASAHRVGSAGGCHRRAAPSRVRRSHRDSLFAARQVK